MRRASTCLAVLAVGLLALPAVAVGGPDGQVQSRSRADPGLPAHRATSSARAPRCKPNTRSQGPNTAGSRRRSSASTSTCRRARSCTRRASRRAPRPCSNRPALGLQEGARQPARSATCWGSSSFGSERVRRDGDARILLRPRRRPRVLHERPLAGVAGNPVGGQLREPRRRRRLRARAHHRSPARLDGARRAVRVGQVDQREGRLGLQEGQGRRSTTAASRRSARRAASRSRPK